MREAEEEEASACGTAVSLNMDQHLLCYLVLGRPQGFPRQIRYHPSQGGRGARSPQTSVLGYYRGWGRSLSAEILKAMANCNWERGRQTNVLIKIYLIWVLLMKAR